MTRRRIETVAAALCGVAFSLAYSEGIWPMAVPAVALVLALIATRRGIVALVLVETIAATLVVLGWSYSGTDAVRVHREVTILVASAAVAFLLALTVPRVISRRRPGQQ